uniref:HslU--HslV peptidase n=1 Tax=Polyblepharides amylifera TaxID=1486889 RepID=A0A7R9SUZ7_9CHLO|mmetsp:Transcript_1171/g.1645  ORF Transcript_1171/g.1645 Transcript_1171/m.1645 type:complete len:253 (+) Transcript_1171:160-918(+)|eukprot:CAMPEP_0196579226 /NCGR_PEP_ID=MMETSP1081-20130531/19404_1 /TAXON_ID=36882 /ORGANISM="Pyramimonas amylifera, Strain CCMP720" /LENGTH=252 /DNA_ID=CAMNT_0041898737 /DNA_START=161 /DNA_END=919 /DNA_ORIENTATION=-
MAMLLNSARLAMKGVYSPISAVAVEEVSRIMSPWIIRDSLLSSREMPTNHTFSRSAHSDTGMHSTTVLAVRKNNEVVIMADGMCSRGSEIVKPNVKKLRRIQDGQVIGGFAGSTADGFALFEMLEAKMEAHPGQLTRSAVELAKSWRSDKYLRQLDAVLVVADAETTLTITGNGDVLEPHDNIVGIGSGGSYATAAARALIDIDGMSAMDIVKKAMRIAADTCIYTNHNFTVETIPADLKKDFVVVDENSAS